MLDLVWLQILNVGELLTLVIDMFMFRKGILTPVWYYFLKGMLIRLSILRGRLTLLVGKVVLINVTSVLFTV